MIRITTHTDAKLLTLKVEGRLVQPWVQELERCWASGVNAQPDFAVRFDLTGVIWMDAAGKEFLAARYRGGAELIVSGCLMKAFVAEIRSQKSEIRSQKSEHRPRPPTSVL